MARRFSPRRPGGGGKFAPDKPATFAVFEQDLSGNWIAYGTDPDDRDDPGEPDTFATAAEAEAELLRHVGACVAARMDPGELRLACVETRAWIADVDSPDGRGGSIWLVREDGCAVLRQRYADEAGRLHALAMAATWAGRAHALSTAPFPSARAAKPAELPPGVWTPEHPRDAFA